MMHKVDYRIIERVEEILCGPCKSTVSSRANSSPMGYVFGSTPVYDEDAECARCARTKGDQAVLPVEAAARKFGLMR